MKFSILTPSYNQLEKLHLCIASVADQFTGIGSCSDRGEHKVEHIIQDAGTPGIEEFAHRVGADLFIDGCLTFQSKSISRSHYRLSIYRERDTGMYDALNRGLKRASGDICAWLNCDEQYLAVSLAKVAEAFKKDTETKVLLGDAILLGPSFEILSYRKTILPSRLHLRLHHLSTPSCGIFFKRSLLTTGHFFDESWKTISDAIWMDGLLERKIHMCTLGIATSTFQFTGNNLGESELARAEAKKWAAAEGAPPSWIRQPIKIVHWIRKLAAGCYRNRTVSPAIYTNQNSNTRTPLPTTSIGFHWPAF